MKYEVEVVQTLRMVYFVKAGSDEEAREKVLSGSGVEEISYSNDSECEIIDREEE